MEKREPFSSRGKEQTDTIMALLQEALVSFHEYHIYPESLQILSETIFFIVKRETEKALILYGSKEYWPLFSGEEKEVDGKYTKICGFSHENCIKLRDLFPFLNPVSHGERRFSFGLGDRLGIASPGHIRTINDSDVFPVLAQQSIRELNLTGRTFESVLDDACWGVFQRGYTRGFGADADHLKTKEEVEYGLRCGYSMITLDCSEYINNIYFDADENTLQKSYDELPGMKRDGLEAEYLYTTHRLDELTGLQFNKTELMRTALVYGRALDFIDFIYHKVIESSPKKIDFEVSIDETLTPTSPAAHFFIASELKKKKVCADNIAPRFCGEFQKGIDYIGNADAFEEQFIVHQKIAKLFGYRISIHSGSDKFSVFPHIGKHTDLNVHVKTAGTSWLEAVRLIAQKDPALYRRMHQFALANLEKAKKYYVVGTNPESIPDVDHLADADLPALMDMDDSRQLMHIAYGLLLQEKDEAGNYVFRNDIYRVLGKYEDEYYNNLQKHIGRHFTALGIK